MPDAVLVANKYKSQDVKKVVEYLKSKNMSQSKIFTKDQRPWGSFEILSEGIGFKVKKITIKSGEALSLQSHKYRSEHWVVVDGCAVVTIAVVKYHKNNKMGAFECAIMLDPKLKDKLT